MPHIKGMIEFDCDFDALAEEMEKSGYVKVVRCKDCKWKQGSECVMFSDARPFPHDYCSRGERREP